MLLYENDISRVLESRIGSPESPTAVSVAAASLPSGWTIAEQCQRCAGIASYKLIAACAVTSCTNPTR